MKRGYKQTEVGVIPEEWDVPYLRQNLLQDATYGIVKAGSFLRSGIPMLRSGEIKGGAITDDQPLISPEKSLEYSRTILKRSDVVIALVGYPGETAVIPDRLIGANISRAVGLLRPASTMTPEFITCYLNSPNGRKEFLRPSAGSAQIVVNLSALNKLRHPLPSLPEQRAIAQVLSDVDALITALDRLIDKKRDLKQAAMQQLLTGNTRLPGFSGIWELKTLGTICEISIGRTPPRLNRAYWGRGHVWLSIADIQSKVVSCSKEEITDLAAATMSVIPKETLLMSFKLSIGRLCFAGCDLYTNEAICSFNNPQANASYLYYALSRTDLSLYGKQAVKGYTLNKESLKLIEVLLPPSPEQTAIATVLSDMDAELSALEARRDKTRALKQGMMQELLTGKTRLL